MIRALLVGLLLLSAGFDWAGKVERDAEGLKASDPAKRREAIKNLSSYDIKLTRPHLLEALRDTDQKVRSEAAKLLARHKVAEAVPIVIEWLDDPDSETKKDAADTLTEIATPEAVAALVRTLGDVDAEVRLRAVIALGKIGGPTVVLPLVARLEDDKMEVRRNAVEALGKVGDPRAVIPVIGAFDDSRQVVEVRVAAVTAAGLLGDPAAVPALLRQLNDQDGRVRLAAIKSLGALKSTLAVPPLVELLQRGGTDANQIGLVAVALGQIASTEPVADPQRRRALVVMVEALAQSALRSGVTEGLQVAGKAAVPALIDHLEGRIGGDPESVVKLLAALHDPRATPTLVAELARGRVGLDVLLEALGASGDARALLPVLGLLSNPDDLVRQQTMTALRGLIGPGARAADVLVRLLSDPVLEIRALAAEYLGIIGAPVAVDPLLRLLADAPEARLRAAAVTALGKIGDARATKALLGVLTRGSPALQPLAADALIYVADPAAVQPLLVIIGGDARGPRLEAARALGGVLRGRRDERARKALEKLADGDSLALSLAAIAALGAMSDPAAGPALTELARGYNPHRQRAAAEALGNLGDKAAVPLLIDLLGAGDDRLASAAAWALGKLGDTRAVPPLLAAVPRRGWATGVNASAALARLAPKDARLLELLRHRERLVRINAAHAAAAAGLKDAVPRLQELARDADADVKLAAERALSRLTNKDPFKPPVRSDWQAFRFVDPDQGDAPVRQEPYYIIAADGLATALYTDERGEAIEEKFPPGEYRIEKL
jgi:HEAT repeat protein